MDLKLKAETTVGDNFHGTLLFEAPEKKLSVEYFFANNEPRKSLAPGDNVNLTFRIGEESLPVIGKFPQALAEAPVRAQCIWVLAANLIYGNVFYILASTEGKDTDIRSISQDMAGEINEDAARVLFGI